MINIMLELTKLGLTNNESRVFATLVKIGKSGAAGISRESGVSYKHIYYVLDSLERKGLVKIVPEKGKKYVPADPKTLIGLVEEKKTDLDELKKKILKLKQLYEKREKEPVEIARGKKNFYKTLRSIPKSKRSQYDIKYVSEYRPEFVSSTRELIRKGVELKELVRFEEETIDNVKKWLKVNKKIKEIPNDGVAVSIHDDSAILITLIKSNTQLLIRDKAFVKLMITLFKKYYDNAEEVKV